jgi:crotonobetainyl-CoA:carnitine CoA-transferase CaiB-like acyl-CoA transferase
MDGDALPFAGRRILDLGGMPSAAATRMLRLFGADVIMVEPPGGGPLRTEPPFDAQFRGIPFGHFAIGRQSICIDLGTVDGAETFAALAATADVVVTDQTSPKETALGSLREATEGAGCTLFEFRDVASASDRAGYVGSNLVDEALGGLLALTGAPGRPPTQIGGNQSWAQVSMHALPVLAALLARRGDPDAPPAPRYIEISTQEAAATSTIQTGNIHLYLWDGTVPRRPFAPNPDGTVVTTPYASIPLECTDGFAAFGIPLFYDWGQLEAWAESQGVPFPEELRDPRFQDMAYRVANRVLADAMIREIAATRSVEEFTTSAQRAGLLAMPVLSPGEIARDPHMVARGVLFEHPYGGRVIGAPFLATEPIARVDTRLPAVGEDTVAVLRGILGMDDGTIATLIGCRAIRVAGP